MTMIQNIKAQLAQLDAEMTAVKNAVETEQRLMNAEEEAKMEKAQADFSTLSRQLKLLGDGEAISNQLSKPQPKIEAARPALSIVSREKTYNHMGAFLQDVIAADAPGGRPSERLMNAVSTAGVEGTNANGGYAVPADLRRDIQGFVLGEESLLSRCDRYNTFSNTLTFPVDTVQSWATTYGAADLSLPETGSYSEVTPSLGQVSVSVGKLGVACSVSEELMEDALAMGSFVSKKLGERLRDRVNFAIISGSGANNTPNGFLLAGNKHTVTTGSENATAKLSADNLINMYYSVPAAQRGGAVWLISDSVEPYLATVKLSGSTMYARPGDFAGQNINTATILGKPVIVMPQMASVGNAGDIAFVNLSQYLAVTKGDVATDVTPYVYWLNDAQTFKAHIRIGGKSWMSAKYTMGDGSVRSPFVVLQGGR